MQVSRGGIGTGSANGQHVVSRALLLDLLRGKLSRAEAAQQAGVPEAALDAARDALLAAKLPPASLTLSSLQGVVERPVRIVRDRSGTPHVYAETARDLFVGYGFAMAQDRLWQIDFYRRRALGRLAEILGSSAVALDRRNRLLGFGPIADQEVAALSPEEAVALDGFAAGINAWIDQVSGSANRLPIEFEILAYAPEAWTPRDSIALMRAFFWQLTGRLENLAAAEAARRYLGPDLATDFLTVELADETIVPSSTMVGGRLVGAGAGGGADASGGSNNWAVSASRSASGSAMLASDPHLPYMLPVGLYQVHLSGAGYDVAGAGYPGTPGVWFGHNDRCAWGITNLVASPRDLYVETLDSADSPRQYHDGDGWADIETRTETIAVRDAEPVTMTVRSTARGPLVDEIVPLAPEPGPNGEPTALSLRWTGQEVLGDVQAVLDVARARDWTSFRGALSHWRLPVFNLVYADVDGHIGWQATGSIPIRGDGDLTRGYRPASDPAHAWTGYIPFDDLPRLEDPARGWVGTANNAPVDPTEQSAPLYGWWASGHRALRLRQILDDGHPITADEMRAMHADVTNLRAAEVLPVLPALLAGGAAGARLLALLDGWDQRMSTDSVAATVFEAFFEQWHRRVLAAGFPDVACGEHVRGFLGSLGAGAGLAQRLLTDGEPGGWFGAGIERATVAEEAAAATLADLETRFGADPAGWRWGALHSVSFRHPLDGRPGTEGLFATAPREVGGNGYVLNANGYSHDRPFSVLSGPEYRLVVDLGDLDRATAVLTTGESGLPGSPHYDDMVDPWVRVAYLPLPFSLAAVEAASTGETRLDP
jgi:penicillin amidase